MSLSRSSTLLKNIKNLSKFNSQVRHSGGNDPWFYRTPLPSKAMPKGALIARDCLTGLCFWWIMWKCYHEPGHLFARSLSDNQRLQISRLRGLPIVHHPGYVCELPPKHRFPMQKFHKVFEFLARDCVVTKERQVRGTMLATRLCLERGMACSTAGGTHHAFPDRGAGFCLINDLAVAARLAISNNTVDRVLIVDLDVHQGDGTAFIFKDRDSVFTFSMHCGKNFPFRKQKSDLDIDLEVNTGDDEFLSVLQDCLPGLLDSFRPGLVLYDAGVDPHKDDTLGRLSLTDQGLFRRDEYVLTEVVRRGVPVATVIGGGYDDCIDTLAQRHTIVHRAATRVWQQRSL